MESQDAAQTVWLLPALRFLIGTTQRQFPQVLGVLAERPGLREAPFCQGSPTQPWLGRSCLVLSGAGTMRTVFLCAHVGVKGGQVLRSQQHPGWLRGEQHVLLCHRQLWGCQLGSLGGEAGSWMSACRCGLSRLELPPGLCFTNTWGPNLARRWHRALVCGRRSPIALGSKWLLRFQTCHLPGRRERERIYSGTGLWLPMNCSEPSLGFRVMSVREE